MISYEGCGCAGGQVTTVSGEQLAEGRRQQKVYEDILGRTFKSETLNWDGSVYSTSKSIFNGRDQVVTSRQFAGADNSSTFQDTTATFDGYGRLKTQHRPEQDANTATTYNYNLDNSIQSVVDARGVVKSVEYDNRGLTTQISHSSSNPNITVTPMVSFVYDNLGNRTQMTDGFGTMTYQYSQLSQLTAETRIFSSNLTDAPQSANGFTHTYNYHLGGALKTVTYPNQVTLNYGLDKAGKLRSVDGTSEGQPLSILSNVDYRAWGSPKNLSFGNGNVAEMTYNNKLQPDTEKYTGKQRVPNDYTSFYNATVVDNEYNYYADGNLQLIEDKTDTTNFHYKYRSQKYDQIGRLALERSGNEALGIANLGEFTKYGYSLGYNEFGNLTADQSLNGYQSSGGAGQTIGGSTSLYTYTNNRITGRSQSPNGGGATYAPVPYDSDGRVLSLDGINSTFDQAGNLVKQANQDFWYDGNGNRVKTKEINNFTEENVSITATTTRYVVYSSVLGEAVEYQTDNDSRFPTINNRQTKTHFYGFGGEIAWQNVQDVANGVQKTVEIKYKTAFEAQRLRSEIIGTANYGFINSQEAVSSRGLEISKVKPQPTTERGGNEWQARFDEDFGETLDGRTTLDGIIVPRAMASRAYRGGSAIPSSLEGYQKWAGFRFEEAGLGIYRVTIPDVYGTKDPPARWTVPHGQPSKGTKIFEGGTFTAMVGWNRTWRTGSWQQTDIKILSDDLENKLNTELKTLLDKNDGDCRNKMNELITAFGKNFKDKKKGLTGIDALAERFFEGKKGYALKIGPIGAYAQYANKVITFNDYRVNDALQRNILNRIGRDFIHELAHAIAGNTGYSHLAISMKIAGIEGLSFTALKTKIDSLALEKEKDLGRKMTDLEKDNDFYSTILDFWVAKYCKDGGKQLWEDFIKDYR